MKALVKILIVMFGIWIVLGLWNTNRMIGAMNELGGSSENTQALPTCITAVTPNFDDTVYGYVGGGRDCSGKPVARVVDHSTGEEIYILKKSINFTAARYFIINESFEITRMERCKENGNDSWCVNERLANL